MASLPLRVGGRERFTDQIETITSPYDGSPVGEVCVASAADMDDAIEVAAEGFSTLRRLPTHRRVAILEGTARLIGERAGEIADVMAREAGKPIRYCRGEVARAVTTFSLGAAVARAPHGEVLPIDLAAAGEGRLCLTQRVPRGPVAAISPFNFPLNLVAHKLSPALAVGTTTVLKPPPQCPITSLTLAGILAEAGAPPESLSVLHCEPDVAQRMVTDERMKVLSFTGSAEVGWRLKGLAGKKQVLLELGGNAPCVLDEGADLDAAMDRVLMGAWAHAGQVCIKVQRILVHESLHDAFLERFVAESRAIPCGDPLDEATMVGPLIERRHVDRVLSWVAEAERGGATVHCGNEADGSVVLPTVLTGVADDWRICREEIFGPVTVVSPFSTFDEALRRCNDSRYGLHAGIFTPDVSRAMRAFDELDYGGVVINDVPTFRVDSFPYGGTKDSGFGREGVAYAAEEMTEAKVLVIRR